ncbi:MAG TPA: 1,4-dihydroxy-2-naphthoate polyprenyltransferase [Lentimicrobium sp.]|nr:1,4-dihydroxy-2-naphthoate polyprenyltransferase [Lentimicrobium sp.]
MKDWIHAARPRTLPLALSSTLLGSFLAWHDKPFKSAVLLLALLTTLFLQILSNLANDYGDSVNGMDNALRVGPKRAVQSGAIKSGSMLFAIIVTSLLALVSGILLIGFGFEFNLSAGTIIFLILGLAAIAAAIKYTVGQNPYGYMGFGDLFVYIFFGLLGVLGTYYLHTNYFYWPLIFPASAVGLLSTAVLNLNNMRDIEGDAKSGKRTMAVILGSKKAHHYHLYLISFAWLCLIAYTLIHYEFPRQWIYLITLPIFIMHLKKVYTTTPPAALDPELKKLALATFATVVLYGVGMM